jgi:phage baseplate assembly protein W
MSDEPRNLLIPFRRDKKRDFASGSGSDLLRSKVLQALMTAGATPRSSGELPWRTAFGAGLELLRHQRSDAALGELARVQIRDALRRWVPEAELVSVKVERSDATLELRVRVRESGRGAAARDTEELVLAVSA